MGEFFSGHWPRDERGNRGHAAKQPQPSTRESAWFDVSIPRIPLDVLAGMRSARLRTVRVDNSQKQIPQRTPELVKTRQLKDKKHILWVQQHSVDAKIPQAIEPLTLTEPSAVEPSRALNPPFGHKPGGLVIGKARGAFCTMLVFILTGQLHEPIENHVIFLEFRPETGGPRFQTPDRADHRRLSDWGWLPFPRSGGRC